MCSLLHWSLNETLTPDPPICEPLVFVNLKGLSYKSEEVRGEVHGEAKYWHASNPCLLSLGFWSHLLSKQSGP